MRFHPPPVRGDDLVESAATQRRARRDLQRLEGKTHEIQDGDVVTVRFNV